MNNKECEFAWLFPDKRKITYKGFQAVIMDIKKTKNCEIEYLKGNKRYCKTVKPAELKREWETPWEEVKAKCKAVSEDKKQEILRWVKGEKLCTLGEVAKELELEPIVVAMIMDDMLKKYKKTYTFYDFPKTEEK